MIENIDKVLERGDRLELLVDKTANMQGNTLRFRKQARRFRSTGCIDTPSPGNNLCCHSFCLPRAYTSIVSEVRVLINSYISHLPGMYGEHLQMCLSVYSTLKS
ncbi:vesicle-associated membrane protein 711 [Phtheirospermum japonicum]|uniref:Vesicle-associated membrane protein 711 n=1 Tax=Phtheirospermum japonicum TaxID=374723 RepID=A0A830DHB4_9LAMI|nr:vesicle-associated membrane protein 711 [Phtheirospermum japonicum]